MLSTWQPILPCVCNQNKAAGSKCCCFFPWILCLSFYGSCAWYQWIWKWLVWCLRNRNPNMVGDIILASLDDIFAFTSQIFICYLSRELKHNIPLIHLSKYWLLINLVLQPEYPVLPQLCCWAEIKLWAG